MKRVTLYNHKPAGDLSLPLVPNVVLKSILLLVKYKQFDEAEYLKSKYSLIPHQENIYRYEVNKAKGSTY